MGLKSVKDYAVKAIAMISMAAVVAGIGVSYVNPVDVTADGAKYTTLYDVFKARSPLLTPRYVTVPLNTV